MKLHLGCGIRRVGMDDFIHVDIRPEVNPDVIADVTNLDGQFGTEALERLYWAWHATPRVGNTIEADKVSSLRIELIYWCHGLEHVPRPLVLPTLRKLRDILNPGGILRLSLPDFRVMAELYVMNGVKLSTVFGPIMGRQDYPENTHYGLYDSETLYALLTEAGFVNVHSYDPRVVWPADFDDYSLAVMEGRFISLNAEAMRP